MNKTIALLVLLCSSLSLGGCLGYFKTKPVADDALPRERLPPRQAERLAVSTRALNLRLCPEIDCAVLAVLQKNDQVELLDSQGDWGLVRVKESGIEGWAGVEFLDGQDGGTPLAGQGPALPMEELAR